MADDEPEPSSTIDAGTGPAAPTCSVQPGPQPLSVDATYATTLFDFPTQGAALAPMLTTAIDDSGRLLVLATRRADRTAPACASWLARFTEDGRSDASFGHQGVLAAPAGDCVDPFVGFDASGRILSSGMHATGAHFIRRLLDSGQVDTSFGGTGDVTVGSNGSETGVQQLAAVGDTIAAAVLSATGLDILHIDEDGTLGASFPFDPPCGVSAMSATAQAVFLGSGASVYALRPDGAPVATFGTGGVAPAFTPDPADEEQLGSVVPAPDGSVFALRIVVASTGDDTGNGSLVHLQAGGAPDPAFGTAGEIALTAFPQSFVRRCDGAGVVLGGWGLEDQVVETVVDASGNGPTTWFPWSGVGAGIGSPIAIALDPWTGSTVLARTTAADGQIELLRLEP